MGRRELGLLVRFWMGVKAEYTNSIFKNFYSEFFGGGGEEKKMSRCNGEFCCGCTSISVYIFPSLYSITKEE